MTSNRGRYQGGAGVGSAHPRTRSAHPRKTGSLDTLLCRANMCPHVQPLIPDLRSESRAPAQQPVVQRG